MHLKELRLNGFKSFAEPTRLSLQPGLTAIVGPNGCGKSNIVDALRWVLGEQSSKSLRASAMADVIFQGSTARKPLNLAEVSLLFSDCEDLLGTAYHEVEVARRVTRDGGSVYTLNGKTCRLKDIQRLFLDTGIGQVSYSFMLQGQIDQVLATNPVERRSIFEEAAGISRYKAQRREALNKLTAMEANLARVTDVIEEVSRQIGSLKRQAGKAVRYKRIQHRLTHLGLAHGRYRYITLHEAVELASLKVGELKQGIQELRDGVTQQEIALTQQKMERANLADDLQQAQQTVYDLRTDKDNAEQQAEFADLRAEDLQNRILALESELQDLEKQKAEVQAQLKGESETQQTQQELFASSNEIFESRKAELVASEEALSEAEAAWQGKRQDLLVLEGKLTRARSESTTQEVDLKTAESRQASLNEDAQRLKGEVTEAEEHLETIRKTLVQRQKQLEKETGEQPAKEEAVKSATAGYREIQEAIRRADREHAQAQARLSLLEDQQKQFAGYSVGAKALLQGRVEGVEITPKLLAEQLDVPAKDRRMLELVLGDAVEALVLEESAMAATICEALAAQEQGRASLVIPQAVDVSEQSIPEFLRPVAESVMVKSSVSEDSLRGLFDGCFFARSLRGFLDFWKASPGFVFFLVATEDGALVDRRGIVWGGAGEGKDDGPLAREAEMKRLKQQLSDLDAELGKQQKAAENQQQALDAAQEALDLHRQRMRETEREVSNLKVEETGALKTQEQTQQRLEQVEQDRIQAKAKIDAAHQRLTEAQERLTGLEEDIEKAKHAITEAETSLEAERRERESKRQAFEEVRLEMAEKKQQLYQFEKGLKDLEQKNQQITQTKLRRQQEIDTLGEQIETFREQAEAHRQTAKEVEKTLGVTMESLESKRTALKEADAAINTEEQKLGQNRSVYEERQGALNEAEIALTRQQSTLEHLVEDIQREFDRELDNIDWKEEIWEAGEALPERMRVDIEEEDPLESILPDRPKPTAEDLSGLDGTDWEEVGQEIEQLRGRLQSMGVVNLLAIEEYRELKERYDFLKNQSDDLWQSKTELVAAIDELNEKSRELFQSTFEQVKKNFSYTFESLFGGGEADLDLIDRDDPLESGIDIVARPPGTKLKNLI